MSQKKSKFLRKIAKLSGRTDDYIKREFRKMDKPLQESYLKYMRENFRRIEEVRKNPPPQKDIIVTDQKI